MLLNEHQSKLLYGEAGLRVPEGWTVTRDDFSSFTPPAPPPWFVKSQVLAGGRGLAGGVARVEEQGALAAECERIFDLEIKGQKPPLLRIEPGTAIAREFYLSFAVARGRESLVLTVSSAGGMQVESDKDAVLILNIPALAGLSGQQIRTAFFHILGKDADKTLYPGFADLVMKLYKAVNDYGLLLAEINPLVLTEDSEWMALDGKVEIDDNVRAQREDLEKFYEPGHATVEENAAREAGLSYVKMDGWVGTMVNGAGLAMGTMDLLNFSGLPAANFMDLGGGANKERMATALQLLFDNPAVRVVFINLFGGIVSAKKVAEAMIGALGGKTPPKPIVARMDGYEAEEGRAMLGDLGDPNISVVRDMAEALEELEALRPEDAAVLDFSLPDEDFPQVAPAAGGTGGGLGITKDSKVLVQGITGKAAQLHVQLMLEYGTNVVAGVTPFKGGQEVLGVPVYNTVREACAAHDIDATIIFVPAAFAAEAILEAAASNVPWAVCITEHIPQTDMLKVKETLRVTGSSTRLVGANTPGLIVPGQAKIGIMPGYVYEPGPVAILSRSGTLTYETASRLSKAGMGQSVCVGIGGDPFIGMKYVDFFELLRDDPATEAILVLGEIGGTAEEELARYVTETQFPKPVLSFIAGRTAPPGKRLGHAGAILEEGGGGIDEKLAALRSAGFIVCPDLASIPGLMSMALGRNGG